MQGYFRLLPYALRQWRSLSAIIVLTIASSAIAALQPWPMKILVDYGLRHDPLPLRLRGFLEALSLPQAPSILIFTAALASLALFATSSGLDAGLTWVWAMAGQRMVFGLATDLFHRLQRLSLLFHSRRSVGDSLSRLTVDTWTIYSLTTDLLVAPVQRMFTLLAVGTVALRLDRQLGWTSLAMAPLLGASSLYFGRWLKKRALATRQAQSRLTSFVQQTLSAIPVVQCFGTEARNRRRFQDIAGEAVLWSQRGALINSGYGMANGLITTAGMAVILFLGGQRVLAGKLSIGGLLVFLAYIKTMQGASQGLLQMYGALKPVEAGIERIIEILDAKEQVADAPHARLLPALAADRAHIRIENVSFAYEPGRPVLHEVTMGARPGEMVALVGATGAGKTTLVSLIPRFFDPCEGRVTLNGVDVRGIRLSSLREKVALVLQESFLLPLTIAENIAYGRPEARREEIVAAAEAANAGEFIRQLPNGYDTQIGERGATLSGGQKQRLAIARALLKNAPVLILDEPTSALDAESEALVLEALERLMEGRTTFIIAHRLSTVRRANRIVVLDRGRIVECGPHEELLAARGIYRRLYSLQFRDSEAAREVSA
jgi:ATP-binding cassette subfamily B protein/subfamily B ATP-binding cassette protein MsbA